MITITVDCNNDEVLIQKNAGIPLAIKCKSGMNSIIQVLETFINSMDYAPESISLEKVDEDRRYTVDEW